MDQANNDDEKARLERKRKIRLLSAHMAANTASEVCAFAARLKLFIEVSHGSNPVECAQTMAYLSGATAMLEFFVNPIAGAFSDAWGRRTFLLLSPAVNSFLKLAVAVAPSPFLMSVERVVGGACGTLSGTTGTFASASDIISDPAELGGTYAQLGAAAGMGVLLGPTIGGFATYLTGGTARVSFACSAVISMMQLAVASTQLPEPLQLENRVPLDPQTVLKKMNPLSFMLLFQQGPTLSKLVGSCAIQCFAEGKSMSDLNSSFMLNDLNMSDELRSAWVTCFGAAMIGAGFIGKWSVPRFGPRMHTTLQNAASVMGFATTATSPSQASMFVMAFFLLFASERGAGMKALAANAAKEKGLPMGQFQGAFANLRALSVAASPLLYSSLYARFSATGSAHRTYFAAALMILVAEAMQQSIPTSAIKALGESKSSNNTKALGGGKSQ
jgi:MFS family permease